MTENIYIRVAIGSMIKKYRFPLPTIDNPWTGGQVWNFVLLVHYIPEHGIDLIPLSINNIIIYLGKTRSIDGIKFYHYTTISQNGAYLSYWIDTINTSFNLLSNTWLKNHKSFLESLDKYIKESIEQSNEEEQTIIDLLNKIEI